ncbi:MAG: hypothetical protein MASP_01183 [Candidatus Methanolliviera sp. GoM_asphalt]|nr:MAG: hypothetical protein MASP_01183 [Candidatus Methanolliviera sp. GoM_asphalt]
MDISDRLKILVALIFVAGCIISQIGDYCEAQTREVWLNKTVSIPPQGYQAYKYTLSGYERPDFVIFIQTDGHPINLRIFDHSNMRLFEKGELYLLHTFTW